MDILDRLTDPAALAAALDATQQNNGIIDAVALANHIKSRVIGQDRVADAVAAQIRRRMIMQQRGKPIGVFCFAGPPGVGKTHFAKVLAEKLLVGRAGLHFVDMSQFGQPHAAAMLFGQAKGYLGSGAYGTLTAHLRDFQKSIVLLDEFEKAHVEVHKRFLTAWNDGFVTEASDGRKISTTSAIFILTTNAASDRIGELALLHQEDSDTLDRAVKTALKDAGFAPEVLSRIDHVFPFATLKGLDIARVVALEIESLVIQYNMEVASGGIDVAILAGAVARHEDKEGGGVRDLSRAIEHEIADSLIEAKLNNAKLVRLVETQGTVTVEVVQ